MRPVRVINFPLVGADVAISLDVIAPAPLQTPAAGTHCNLNTEPPVPAFHVADQVVALKEKVWTLVAAIGGTVNVVAEDVAESP